MVSMIMAVHLDLEISPQIFGKIQITLVFQQCCGFGMFIQDPRSWILPIPDLRYRIQKQQQKRGAKKKFVVIPFYVATKFTKLKIILVLKCWRKKVANFQRIQKLFTLKIVTKLSKICVWDPGSGKNLFQIMDPDLQHCVSGAWGKMIHEKNLKQKILWHCPSNPMPESSLSPSQGLWIWPLKSRNKLSE